MIIFFFQRKKMQQKNKVLEDISDICLGSLKEKYSPKYFYHGSHNQNLAHLIR